MWIPLENLSSLSRHFWRVLFRPQASGTNFATAQAIAPKVALCVCLGMLQPTLAQLDRWSLVLFDGCPRPCQSPADFTMQDWFLELYHHEKEYDRNIEYECETNMIFYWSMTGSKSHPARALFEGSGTAGTVATGWSPQSPWGARGQCCQLQLCRLAEVFESPGLFWLIIDTWFWEGSGLD